MSGTLNLREWTKQEWTIRHHIAGMDFAGVDNAAPCGRDGQCGSGQCRSGKMPVCHKRSLMNDARIKNCINRYDSNAYTPMQLLDAMSRKF